MKNRILLAGALMLIGYSVLILISGAPWRVHIAHGITWLPTLLIGCAIFWHQTLTWPKKAALIATAIVLGALLTGYASSLVILKYEFDISSIIGIAVFLLMGTAGIIFLTRLVAQIFESKFQS